MTNSVKHVLRGVCVAAISSTAIACSTDPCEQHPDSLFCGGADDEVGDGETSGETSDTGEFPEPPECVPFLPEDADAIGYEYACQGTGNGWLVMDVYGSGTQPPECVNWGGDKPESPTTDDCVPIDLTMLPNDVPSPGACCKYPAKPENVVEQCVEDCAYAACKLAIAKLREAALALPHPDSKGLKKNAEERVRDDLFGFADKLELPDGLQKCAEQLIDADGEPAQVWLGAGDSNAQTLGHIENATLTLHCSLDAIEPFVMQAGNVCDAPPNIPLVDGESKGVGVVEAGAVTMFGPKGEASVELSNVAFEFREVYMHDGSVDFFLESFEAEADDASVGSLSMIDPHIHLVAPVGAPLVGEAATFPAGSLRMEVSGVVVSEREVLFGGRRSSAVYVNTGAARIVRTADGFAFVDVPFEVGGILFVLNTDEADGQVR